VSRTPATSLILLKLHSFYIRMQMSGYLAYSIYSYIASVVSWRIEKLYRNLSNDKQIKIWFILKNIFRVTGTGLLIAHLML